MAVKLPDDPKKLKALCERYQKQVKELTQKCERENLDWGGGGILSHPEDS